MTERTLPADEQLYYLRMSGRCASGFERDSGRVVHAIRSAGFPGWRPALCGARPGRKGNGWSDGMQPAPTCPRCIKKVEKRWGNANATD